MSTNTEENPARPETQAAADTAAQDAGPRVHYALTVDTSTNPAPIEAGFGLSRSESAANKSPTLRRRHTRAQTFRTVSDYDEFDTARPGWHPGAEPGFDPAKADGGHASMPTLSAPCDITVVDFSQTAMVTNNFDNQGFIDFLEQPQDKWIKCRWININGLSWDVIQAVGRHKHLHKLALEDIMELKNRTKAEWYPAHAFIVLTLQKLVHLVQHDSSESESDDAASVHTSRSTRSVKRKLKRLFRSSTRNTDIERPLGGGSPVAGYTANSPQRGPAPPIRTLQRYHASPNEARTEYMERHSSLAGRGLAVSAEQVAIFLTADNTIVTFFEMSAADVERPIITRLSTPGTILRQSCDASLLVQAVMDAIVDLAVPLTTIYNDLIGDLELDVLTNPSIKQSKSLYIIISEINKMLSFLNPIDNLVNVLRDHRTELGHDETMRQLQNPASGILITPMTHTYLGDVLDHCVILVEAMVQIKKSADNLIDLIFNITSANQNETMRQLTTITIIFLPLTFITGYFGQNFEPFPQLFYEEGIIYFWRCAIPTIVFTILLIMYTNIRDFFTSLIQRRHILSIRKSSRRKADRNRNGGADKDRALRKR